MADLPPADPCATRRAMNRLLPRPQGDALDAAAQQVIDNVLAAMDAETRHDLGRIRARERLANRVNMFLTGLTQIGFHPILDADESGRLRLTIDPDAWDGPIAGPLPVDDREGTA